MKKILIVDDNQDFLLNMKNYIKKLGYDIAVTTSCKEALGILTSFVPDLIFMDVNVGNEDGREMCRSIKALAIYQHIPVILISANHEYAASYEMCGANLFVSKPFSLSILPGIIKNYM